MIYGIHGIGRMGAFSWLWVRLFEWFESLTTNGLPTPRSPFESLRTGPSRASGQALREPQDRPFESLRTGPSRASGQALREPQDRPFESLRTGPGRTGRDGEIPALAGNAFLDYINGLDPSPTDARKGAMLYSLLADRRHFGEDFHA